MESFGGQDEQTILNTATIEDNFTEDIILVSLTQKATCSFRRYTTADFPELKLANVTEMTESLSSRAEHQVRNDEQGIFATNNNTRRIDMDSFRRILKLELAEPSKKMILDAIAILEKRDDVRAANPNYIGEFSTITPNAIHAGSQWSINNIQLPNAWNIAM